MANVSVHDFVDALNNRDVARFAHLCKTRPELILHYADGELNGCSTLLNFVCRGSYNACYFRLLCQTLLENAMDIDESHGGCHMTAMKMALFFHDNDRVMILLEYGSKYNGESEKSRAFFYICRNNVEQKWARCASAASTVLLTRQQVTTYFHLIGHDMTRLIAQEVWAHKRHEAWE